MSPKKPTTAAIKRAGYLTEYSQRPADPLSRCNLCEEFASWLDAYREHDEFDRPLPGNGRLLFLGYEHEECERVMLDHPRLYEEDMGEPGAFPRLCGDCAYRDGLNCTHHARKANGGKGKGLEVTTHGGGIIFCSIDEMGEEGACSRSVRRAFKCAGFARVKLVVVPSEEALANKLRDAGWTCDPPSESEPPP